MNTPLLTRDGFPRADIDVAQSTYTGDAGPRTERLITVQSEPQELASFAFEMIIRAS